MNADQVNELVKHGNDAGLIPRATRPPSQGRPDSSTHDRIGWVGVMTAGLLAGLSIFLICFRLYDSIAEDYDVTVAGYRIGNLFRALIVPALGCQLAAVAACWAFSRRSRVGIMGFGGGLLMCWVIAILWADVSEMLIAELRHAVRTELGRDAQAIGRYFDANGKYPSNLDALSGGIAGPLIVRDPYSRHQSSFRYESTTDSFILLSCGPDRKDDLPSLASLPGKLPSRIAGFQYDPSNGIFSSGDIIEWSVGGNAKQQ